MEFGPFGCDWMVDFLGRSHFLDPGFVLLIYWKKIVLDVDYVF